MKPASRTAGTHKMRGTHAIRWPVFMLCCYNFICAGPLQGRLTNQALDSGRGLNRLSGINYYFLPFGKYYAWRKNVQAFFFQKVKKIIQVIDFKEINS